jgi:hypothetical protein
LFSVLFLSALSCELRGRAAVLRLPVGAGSNRGRAQAALALSGSRGDWPNTLPGPPLKETRVYFAGFCSADQSLDDRVGVSSALFEHGDEARSVRESHALQQLQLHREETLRLRERLLNVGVVPRGRQSPLLGVWSQQR